MNYEVRQTEEFATWLDGLRDTKAQARIVRRVELIEQGSFGDVEPVGEGVSELRIFYGPGYRVYFTVRKRTVVFLLGGGQKRTQTKDIKQAKKLAQEV